MNGNEQASQIDPKMLWGEGAGWCEAEIESEPLPGRRFFYRLPDDRGAAVEAAGVSELSHEA